MSSTQVGVAFPVTGADGARSTGATGRAVVADALRAVDPPGARAVDGERRWRSAYPRHFRRLVEAGLASREAALAVAADGLASLHARMRVVHPDGQESALGEALTEALSDPPAGDPLGSATVRGGAPRERTLSVPYRGERLAGDALHRRLDAWLADGSVEPSFAEAVRAVAAAPDWLDLSDLRVAVVGAGAEMAPLAALLRWGADVVAVDLPRSQLWRRVLGMVEQGAGSLTLPVRPGAEPVDGGVDLLTDLPAAARWLREQDGRLVLGNYVYADGATNVRVAAAVDALTVHLQDQRDDLTLAFLATPTDVFAVPAEVRHATQAYGARRLPGRLAGGPLRTASGGRLLRRHYAADAGPAADGSPSINNSIVPQQGPNYALAKRLQRWRATLARDGGATVSLHVAPPTRTRSVLRSRALSAAYAGAPRFGVHAFEPATSNTLMAALLVHDLRSPRPAAAQPWQDEAFAAAHGGLWRCPYEPRSALGLAALLGLPAAARPSAR